MDRPKEQQQYQRAALLPTLPVRVAIDVYTRLLFRDTAATSAPAAARLRVAAPRPVAWSGPEPSEADALDWAVALSLRESGTTTEASSRSPAVAVTAPSLPVVLSAADAGQGDAPKRSRVVSLATSQGCVAVTRGAGMIAPRTADAITSGPCRKRRQKAKQTMAASVIVVEVSPDPAVIKALLRFAKHVDLSRCYGISALGVAQGPHVRHVRHEDGFASECNGLESVALPPSVTSVGCHAFNYSGVSELDLSVCPRLRTIDDHVGWADRLERVRLPASVESIGHSFLIRCPVRDVDLSHCTALKSLGTSAFASCGALERVVLPASLTQLGDGFCLRSAVREIDLSRCVELRALPSEFAPHAPQLQQLLLPASITAIGEAFLYRAGLQELDLSPCVALAAVGDDFAKDSALTTLRVPASLPGNLPTRLGESTATLRHDDATVRHDDATDIAH